jgi:hypothetical protein
MIDNQRFYLYLHLFKGVQSYKKSFDKSYTLYIKIL